MRGGRDQVRPRASEPSPTLEKPRNNESRRRILVLGAILTIGCVLRLLAARDRSLLDDEVGTGVLVRESYGYLMTHYTDWQTHPGHLLLARLSCQLLSFDEFAMRLPSLIFGLLGIVLVERLATRLFSPTTGLLAALLLALHPYHLFYSQTARSYAVSATLATATFLLTLRIAEKGRLADAAAWVAVTTASVYCHATGVLLVPLQVAIGAWLARRDNPPRFRRVVVLLAGGAVLSGILVAALYIPLLPEMLEYRSRWTGEEAGGFSSGFVPLLLTTFFGGRGVSIYAGILFGGAGLLVAVRRAAERLGAVVIVLWPLALLLFYVVNNTTYYPWVYVRFFLIALPIVVIAVAHGLVAAAAALRRLTGAGERAGRFVLPGLVVLFLLLTSTKTAAIAFGRRDTSWREAVSAMQRTLSPDVVVFPVPMLFNPYFYYEKNCWTEPHTNILPTDLSAWIEKVPLEGPLPPPFAYLFDVVPPEDVMRGLAEKESFEVSRFGTATLVHRKNRKPVPARDLLLDIVSLIEGVISYIERVETTVIREDWEYWRMGLHHEHRYGWRDQLPNLYLILAAAQRRLGMEVAAAESAARVTLWISLRCPPEQVRSSWCLLEPRFDFLDRHFR